MNPGTKHPSGASAQRAEALFKITLLAGLVASLAVLGWSARTNRELASWIFWILWPAMALHQCEENVFTELVLGKRYGFIPWARSVGYDITPWRAFRLNVLMAWSLAIASGLIGTHFVYFPLFIAAVETVNAFWHLSVTSLQRRWSPGTLSGVLLVVPVGFSLFHFCLVRNLVTPEAAFGLLLLACVSHHMFLGSLPKVAATTTQ